MLHAADVAALRLVLSAANCSIQYLTAFYRVMGKPLSDIYIK